MVQTADGTTYKSRLKVFMELFRRSHAGHQTCGVHQFMRDDRLQVVLAAANR